VSKLLVRGIKRENGLGGPEKRHFCDEKKSKEAPRSRIKRDGSSQKAEEDVL